MRHRSGFVSNSSSSSFVVALSVLTEPEKFKILSYGNFAANWKADRWDITEDEQRGVISGFTNMDNGDLDKYLGKRLSNKCTFN